MNEDSYDAPVGEPTGDRGGSPASPSGPAQPSTGAQPPAGAQPAAPGQAAPTQGEWVSRHHLNDVWKARREDRALIQSLQQQLQQLATPRAPAAPPDERNEAIKAEFFKLFPEFASLAKIPADKLEKLIETVPQLEAHTTQYWNTAGATVMRQLAQGVDKIYGGQPSDEARRDIEVAFINRIEHNPEWLQRYISQDPTLVQDFLKSYEASHVAPFRRSALAIEEQRGTRRAALPRPAPRSSALGAGPPAKPQTEEERHEAAWAALQAQR